MTTFNAKYAGMVAIALAMTIAPIAQSAFADQPADKTDTKVRAFQAGTQITEDNPAQLNTDTDCVGGILESAGAVKMVCYLIPPGVSNNDNSNAIATLDTTSNIACPADAGFGNDDECFSVTFDGSLFDQQGDYHFHAEFYDAQGNLIADGRQTFQNHSFFVLPESPIGILALIGSSLAVLGGFMFLRNRSTNLPI